LRAALAFGLALLGSALLSPDAAGARPPVAEEIQGLFTVRLRTPGGGFRGRAWIAASTRPPRVAVELLSEAGGVVAEMDADEERSAAWLVGDGVAAEAETSPEVLGDCAGGSPSRPRRGAGP
jgi:hypothetical protein